MGSDREGLRTRDSGPHVEKDPTAGHGNNRPRDTRTGETKRRGRSQPSTRHPVARQGSEEPLLHDTKVVLGLLGGIASGKSHVAQRTAALAGGALVDADALAHEALHACAADGRLATELGPEFVQNGRADVQRLGARAFEDADLLRRLERLVHPFCHTRIKDAVERHRAGEGPALLVLDVALLLEVGLDRHCDALWFIEVSDEVRVERAAGRGLTHDQIRLRETFQTPTERKRARADLVIRNDVDDAELDRQILAGLADLGLAPPEGGAQQDTSPADATPKRRTSQASPQGTELE